MPGGTATIDEQLKVNLHILGSVEKGWTLIDDFKSSVASGMAENNSALKNLGTNLAKSFSLQSLGTKIGDAFNSGFKKLTSPFTAISGKIGSAFSGIKSTISNLSPAKLLGNLGNKIGSVFGGLKSKLANLTPMRAIGGIKNKFVAAKDKVKKLLGKDIESLKQKFFSSWANPNRVMKYMYKLNEKLWRKYGDRSKGAINKKILTTVKQNNKAQNRYYANWSKPKKVASIFAKEFKSAMVFAGADGKSKSPTATQGQVFGAIAKAVDKIAAAVSWFLGGPGLGIALAIGLVPPILILAAAFIGGIWLLCDTIKAIWEPLSTKVSEGIGLVVDILGTVKNFLSKFLDSPISTMAKGIKNLTSSDKNAGGFDISVIDKILSNLKIFNTIENYIVKAGEYFDKSLNTLMKINNLLAAIPLAFVNNIGKSIKSTFNKVSDVFNSATNKIKATFVEPKKDISKQNEETNPFTELISSFETMRKDTVKLLTDIKTSIINIEKNKIQVGNINAMNNAMASDAKKTNELQQINYNYTSDVSDITPMLKQTNKMLEGILINTSLKETGETKSGSVQWTLEG